MVKSRSSPRRLRRVLTRPLLPLFGVVAAACWALALFVLAIDPLNLYPWGVPPRLQQDGDYSPNAKPYLIDAAAKDPEIDTILLGSSTARNITASMMEAILPGTHKAFNMSYSAPLAEDRSLVQREVLRYSAARRVLFEVDLNFALPTRLQRTRHFPLYLYDDAWWNDIRVVNQETLGLALNVLKGKPLWNGSWSSEGHQKKFQKQYERAQSPEQAALHQAAIDRQRPNIDRPARFTCKDLDAINDNLVPFARALSARGVEMDLWFPIYSTQVYYEWLDDPLHLQTIGPSFLNDQLQMRQCLVEALDGIPHVRVFAFNDLVDISDDLRNYRDLGHLQNMAPLQYILQSIAKDQHRLTRDNVGQAIEAMRRHVLNYNRATYNKVWQPPA